MRFRFALAVGLAPWLGTACGGVATSSGAAADPGPDPDAGMVNDGGVAPRADAGASPDGGSPFPDGTAPRSGSRITVSATTSEDSILGIKPAQDSKHGVPCAVDVATDGVSRCLPASVFAEFVYVDAACKTEGVVVHAQADCIPAYLVRGDDFSCPKKVVALKAGAPLDSDSTYYRNDPADGCVPTTLASPGLVAPVTESPAAEWAAFTGSVVPLTSALGVEVWDGEDGSRLLGSLVLSKSGERCSASPRVESELHAFATDPGRETARCVPSAREEVTTGVFADEKCSVAAVLGTSCEPPVLLEDSTPDRCQRRVSTFHEVGQTVSAVHESIPQACGPAVDAERGAYVPGDAVDVTRYPELRVRTVGDGALKGYFFESEGKLLAPVFNGVIGAQGDEADVSTSCVEERLTGSTWYCARAVEHFVGLFADAKCTVPLGVQTPSSGVCAAPVAVFWGSAPLPPYCGGTDAVVSLRRLTTPYKGPVYGQQIPGKCDLQFNAGGSEGFYSLGDAIDPGSAFTSLGEKKL